MQDASGGLTPASLLAPALENVSWCYYDSEILLTTMTSVTLFVNVAGKTIQQSNMRMSATIPAPQIFRISTIGVGIMADFLVATGAAITATSWEAMCSVLEDSRLTFTVQNKPMFECPLWKLPLGGGANAWEKIDNAGAGATLYTSFAHNGYPSPAYMYRLWRPIVINPVENFSVLLQWGHGLDVAAIPAIGAGVESPRIFVTLEGVLRRGIQ